MNQMFKNVILLVAAVCGVSAQAAVPGFVKKTGSVVAWPLKKLDDIQRVIFTTKTAKNKAFLAFLACMAMRFQGFRGENANTAHNNFLFNTFQVLARSLTGPGYVRRDAEAQKNYLDIADGSLHRNYLMFTCAVWTSIALTAWNNDRNTRDAKKAADEAKAASRVEVLPAV